MATVQPTGNVIKELDPDLYKEYVKEKWEISGYGNGKRIQEPRFDFREPIFKKKDPKLRDLVPINKLTTTHPARTSSRGEKDTREAL